MAKEEVSRGTRKRFEVYITDLADNAQDPDSCIVLLEKSGEYSYDSPRGPYTCSKTGTTGYWGADVNLSDSMTLGDWTAKFTWLIGTVYDGEDFEFTVIDKRRPFISQRDAAPNVEVVG